MTQGWFLELSQGLLLSPADVYPGPESKAYRHRK